MKTRTLLLPFALLALGHSAQAQCPSYQNSIAPMNGASGIRFGDSVDLDDQALFVGSPLDDEGGGVEAGSVRALPRTSSGSFLQGWRLAPTTVAGDHFGCSVAVSGADGIAGAEGDDKVGVDSGAAYLMHRVPVFNKQTWVMGVKIKGTLQAGARFGASVDMAPGVAVIGAPGAGEVYVFEDDGTGIWTQTGVLSGSGEFGAAVATNGLMTIVGAPSATASEGCDSGLVWVYERVDTSSPWLFTQALAPTGCSDDAEFGASVSLDLPWLAVGAPGDRTAYAFPEDAFQPFGSPTALSGAGAVVGPFGSSVGLEAGTLLVGEPGANLVHIYDCISGCAPELQVVPSGTGCVSGCEFGAGVATHSGMAVAGAPAADLVYTFQNHDLCEQYCTAGTSASGCQAKITAAGTPSASAASGFVLSASTVEGDKDGLFYFGAGGRIANVWGNGTSFQCVLPPIIRTGFQAGTGTAGVCDGAFLQDLNAQWCSTCPKPQQNPGAGAVVQAQLWYRDPQNTSNQTTSLSDAIEFTVQP